MIYKAITKIANQEVLMIENKFIIEGMVSQACVGMLVEQLRKVTHFRNVDINIDNKVARIFSEFEIPISEIREILKTLPEFSIYGLEDADTQVL